jgi:hypothetical protein
MKKYTLENLLNVETFVEEYHKENEKLNNDFDITEIDLDTLKKIFNPISNDFDLYLSYEITEMNAEMINENLKTKIKFNFEKYEYYLQRVGNYR